MTDFAGSSFASPSSPRPIWATAGAAVAVFGAFVLSLRVGGTAGDWWPPAVAVVGLGLAAGRGPAGGPVLAVWAGALHAAATGGPVGVSVAVGAVLTAAVRALRPSDGRRWLLAGLGGWVWAAAVGATGASAGGGSGAVSWVSLPAAVGLGLACGGVAAAWSGRTGGDRGGW